MKTVLRTIAIVAAFIGLLPTASFAQTQDNALYVYRNDGDFTAFLREDIDSIVLSHLDADSVWQQEFVMQEFHTPDSVYRIPISAIDSVSLVQPEIIYQPNVIRMDESGMYSWLQSVNGMTLTFSSDMPSNVRPSKNDVLLYLQEDTTFFAEGFAGKVYSVEETVGGIVAVCDSISDVTDIFSQFIAVEKVSTIQPQTRASGTYNDNIPIDVSLNWDPGKLLGFDMSAQGGLKGDIDVRVVWNITKEHQMVSLKARSDWSLYTNFQAKCDIPKSKQFWYPKSFDICGIRFPLVCPVFKFHIYASPFVKTEGSFEINSSITSPTYTYMTVWNYVDGSFNGDTRQVSTGNEGDPPTLSSSLSLNGSIHAGGLVGLYLGTIECLGVVGTAAEFCIGPKVSATMEAGITSEHPVSLYSTIKDSKIDLSWLTFDFELYGKAKFMGHGIDRHTFANGSLSLFNHSWYLLPEFSQPEYTAGASNSTAVITTTPSRDLLMPVSLGIGVENEDGETVETKWNSVEYQNEDEWPLNVESESFSGLSAGTYTAYPYVRILGQELRAVPSENFKIEGEMCPDDNHVHAIDLGLPSGTKWACCNVGASSPEGYGGYYAWGETEEKSDYGWDTYAYSIYDSNGFLTGCTNIGSDIAGTSYDVVHVKWGGSWHMPTLTQIEELVNSCTWTWTTQNGVYGQLVTGPNGNSIFLPAAGYRHGTSLYNAGSYGNAWSSTADESYSNFAYNLYFDSGRDYWCSSYRYFGQSVRPVSE